MHSDTRLSRMLVVVGLFGSCSIYLYIVYTQIFVALASIMFAFSISFMLKVLVFVAFSYSFHVNDIKSFRFCVKIFSLVRLEWRFYLYLVTVII